ncbi:MAG: hypothetical protein JJD92_09025 [Frankiaceae bacterium]|nr:hypothetical protein [Frankiaceae bacterium]
MTEQPPKDPAPPDAVDDDGLDDPWHDQLVEVADDFGAPDIVAVVAFVLAVASVFGFGLLSGSTYSVPFIDGVSNDGNKAALVTGTILGAVLALIPAWLGWRASSRSLPADPRWVVVLARSAVVLALTSGFLHLVVAVLQAAQDGPSGFTSI